MTGTSQGRSAPDKVMAAALGRSARAGGPDCLDADELAAYYERSLDAREQARAEAHVASCRACQERLVALVRSEPAPAPAPAWWRPWVSSPRRWAWAAPALAAGLAAAVWLATRPAPAPGPDLTVASRFSVPEKAASPQEARDETSAVPAPITAAKPELARPAEAPPPVGGGQAEALRKMKQETAREAPAAGVVAGKVGPAEERAARADERAAKESDFVAGRRATANQALASAAPVVPPILLPAPGGRIVWRIDTSGAIARSDDGGTTWRGQATAGVGLTAGSAVSETVCWVAGLGGAVLRTEDGERWERVTSPAASDLVRLEAADALHAQVTAGDGRRFETSDGGKTWVVRPQV